MTVLITERAIENEAGAQVRVRIEDDLVQVRWTCGDTRSFTPDEAREAVENARLSAEEHPGVWMTSEDHYGESYAIMIVDGELYADNRPTDASQASHVPWRSVRKAMTRAAKQAG